MHLRLIQGGLGRGSDEATDARISGELVRRPDRPPPPREPDSALATVSLGVGFLTLLLLLAQL